MKKLSKLSSKKKTEGIGKARVLSHAEDVLLGIERDEPDPYDPKEPYKIRCFIHKITLSGPYGYDQITTNIGPLYLDRNFDPKTRSPNYKNKFIRNRKYFSLIFFLNPKQYLPSCYIEIHPKENVSAKRYKKFLIRFNANLPGLKVSKVEYASDQFCHRPSKVERLFYLERRHLYVSQSRKCGLIGEDYDQFGRKNRLNFVFHNGRIKIYERGPDDEKNGKAWERKFIDRVRLEYTATRTDLKKNGLDDLSQFIVSPKFLQMNKNRFRFMCFKGSNKLPKIWEDYNLPDARGFEGSFQAQHIEWRKDTLLRKKIKNIKVYTARVEEFDPLLSRLESVWASFDQEW